MNNSNNSDIPNNRTVASHELNVFLPEFLTPSLNRILGKHWTALSKEREKTARALDSALLASPASYSMLTTLLAAANSSSMPSVDADLFRTTIRRQLKSHSVKSRPNTKPKKELPSESHSIGPNEKTQGEYEGENSDPCQDKF